MTHQKYFNIGQLVLKIKKNIKKKKNLAKIVQNIWFAIAYQKMCQIVNLHINKFM